MANLSPSQQELLQRWLPDATVERDHSWGLVETTVLQVTSGGARFIVKAGGDSDLHIAREVHAHRRWLGPWVAHGRAPALVHGDADAKLLVTRYLPGALVLGTAHEDDPGTYRQAGELLAALHAQPAETDAGYERRENDKTLSWLDGPHRIDPATVERIRAEIAGWPTPAALLVPTHGDWQPRNWLLHDGVVAVIDFGRAGLRPAATDFCRLAVQEFRRSPLLEEAFLDGYGADPREPGAWHRSQVREAIGTVRWAHRVRDEHYEAQGHRMIAEALAAT